MENVTEELVRQNGNQAAVVMADFAGGGGGGAITPPIDIDKKAAVFTSLPEAGKIYNIPFVKGGFLVPVYIVDIEPATEDTRPSGTCLFCMFFGYDAQIRISWDLDAPSTSVTTLALDISESKVEGEFLVSIVKIDGTVA